MRIATWRRAMRISVEPVADHEGLGLVGQARHDGLAGVVRARATEPGSTMPSTITTAPRKIGGKTPIMKKSLGRTHSAMTAQAATKTRSNPSPRLPVAR